MTYRREIDGLRAVAVLPVMLFHAGIPSFSGGYVGVDVFFVISGYLIASLILTQRASGEFSLAQFYERRVRRILPALLLVMGLCIPFAWLWLLPTETKNFSQSLVAVAALAANVLFHRESGYFDGAADDKPLLHTWSLSVEEQFYLIFPLLLLGLGRVGRRWTLFVIAALAAGSMMIAESWLGSDPSAAFYLLPSRAWELAMGAGLACAFPAQVAPVTSPRVREASAIAGLGLILYAVFAYDGYTRFPGVAALVPTVGAALVILFATPQTMVGRLLSTAPFVGLGLVSYSAYLWHQPLLAFARHRSVLGVSTVLTLALLGASLALAYLSWRFVERPFRDSRRITRPMLIATVSLALSAVAAAGVAGHLADGRAGRSGSRIAQLAALESRLRPNRGVSSACDGFGPPHTDCRTSEAPAVMLWGDSFAMHLADALRTSAPQLGLVQATTSACGPVLGIAPITRRYPRAWAEQCIAQNDRSLALLRETPSIRFVVLSSPFEMYLDPGSTLLRRDGQSGGEAAVVEEHFLATLESIRAEGRVPVVIAPPPRGAHDVGRCLLKTAQFGSDPSTCDFTLQESRRIQGPVRAFLDRIALRYPVVFLDSYLCRAGQCFASINDVLMYIDDSHLSVEGSRYIGTQISFEAVFDSLRATIHPPR